MAFHSSNPGSKMHLVILTILSSLVPTFAMLLKFADPKGFYNDLYTETQQFILHHSNLDDKETRHSQHRLLVIPGRNILRLYNSGCLMVTKGRARGLLERAKREGKEFERTWLGVLCLSDTIIEERRLCGMWPPRQVPLLVRKLSFKYWKKDLIEDILREALLQPEHWYTILSLDEIDWDEIQIPGYWRLITAAASKAFDASRTAKYLYRALINIESVRPEEIAEEILIKLTSILPFVCTPSPLIDVGFFLLTLSLLRGRFEALQTDHWCKMILDLVHMVIKGPLDLATYIRTLANSGMVSLAFWMKHFDRARATNNLLLLFNQILPVALDDQGSNMIRSLLLAFLSQFDVSIVIPLLMRIFVRNLSQQESYAHFIQIYHKRWSKDDRLFSVLYDLIPPGYRAREAIQYRIYAYPLIDLFRLAKEKNNYVASFYGKRLESKWLKDETNWHGFLETHKQMLYEIREIFEQFMPYTGNPRLDRVYPLENWQLLFSCILFEAHYDLPIQVVPSKCFLTALLFYHRHNIIPNWEVLRMAFQDSCHLPTDQKQEAIYLQILMAAHSEWQHVFDGVPWITAQILFNALLPKR